MNFFVKKESTQKVPCSSQISQAEAVSSPSRCRGSPQEENCSEAAVPVDNGPFAFYVKAAAKAQADKVARKQRREARWSELEERRTAQSTSQTNQSQVWIPETLGESASHKDVEKAAGSNAPHSFYEQERERRAAERAKRSKKGQQMADSDCQVDVAALMPTDEEWNSILTLDILKDIVFCLPSWIRFHRWHLVYSPKVHGVSMRTFYRQQSGPNVVLVRDAQGHVFGGFAAQEWFPATHGYGEVQSFVFNTGYSPDSAGLETPQSPLSPSEASSPGMLRSPRSPETINKEGSVFQVFPCCMKSGGVIQWGCEDMIALGSALVIQNNFLNGSSSACSTFKSPPLSSLGNDFIISDFECWAIGDDD